MKKNDFITIFNQLTSSELADYSLFTNVLENHYEKFKFLYSLIDDIDLSRIDKIYCEVDESALITYIQPYDIEYINEIIFNMNDRRHNYSTSKYFTIDIVEKSTVIQIFISLSENQKEDFIYANRFV